MSVPVNRALAIAAWSCLLPIASSASVASIAHAGGLELMPGGAHSVGRGGAIAARPTNAMTLLQNPAAMGELVDDQMVIGLDTAFHEMCVDPYGYYGWGVSLPDERTGVLPNQDARRSEFGDPASSSYGRRQLDSVCNSAKVAPLPQAAFAYHLTDRVSVGFGFVAPVLVTGLQYGGRDGTIAASDRTRPTPTRYQLIRQEVLFGLNPAAAVSYRVLPQLAFGLALQVTMASLRNTLVMPLNAGTSPAEDTFVGLEAHDYFMPALVFAVHAKPTPRVTLMGAFTWNDGLRGSGDITFTTNTYHQGATGNEFVPLKNDPVKLRSIRAELPWVATVGVRYAQPLSSAAKSGGDPLATERWDIEFDASYSFRADPRLANHVDIGQDFVLEARRANGTPQMPLRVDSEEIAQLTAETHQLNSVALRLGGSYNALPGRLGLSAGGFFESRGSDAAYASVENFAFGRVGIGLGVLMRFGSIDLSAAYAHVFQEELTVAPPAHQPRDEGDEDDPSTGFDQRIYENGELSERPVADPDAPAIKDADAVAAGQQAAVFSSPIRPRRVVNAGRYTANFNILSVGLAYRF